MKLEEKKIARTLRSQGLSINEICQKHGFAKGSVSVWVRNIELTKEQRNRLTEKGISKDAIERRRITRLTREDARRQIIIDEAKKDIQNISEQELKLIGAALYWAEGGKTTRGNVQFSNGDSRMIELMMEFYKKICKVPQEKFRGYIHIHPHLNVDRAEKYWSSVSKIPLSQFYKTYSKPNISSQNKRDTLPFGTFDIIICSTELFLRMKGWREAIYEKII